VVAGSAWFLLAAGVLHFVRKDLNPLERGVSRYAAGPFGIVASSAFAALTIAVAAVAFSTGTAFWIAAAGLLVVTMLPLRSGEPGRAEYFAHQFGGAIFFLSAAAGGLALDRGPVIRALAWNSALAVLLFFTSRAAIRGLLQRWCFLSIVALIVAASQASV
jgi:hypothetical protein